MMRHDQVSTTLAGLLALAAVGVANADPGCCDETNCPAGCGCDPVCVATQEPAKEEKHCWCVTCEEVCVPRVRCPWEPGGSPLTCFHWLERLCGKDCGCGDLCASCEGCCDDDCTCRPCGRVKYVRDLEKKTYEVDVCQWKWEIRRLPPCCCSRCGSDATGRRGCGCAVED